MECQLTSREAAAPNSEFGTITMKVEHAVAIAKAYAADLGVPWGTATKVERLRAWWLKNCQVSSCPDFRLGVFLLSTNDSDLVFSSVRLEKVLESGFQNWRRGDVSLGRRRISRNDSC